MQITEKPLSLPEGLFYATVQVFEDSDRPFIHKVYDKWRTLCTDVAKLKSRTINLPEGLSEGAFCLNTGAYRIISGISGANSSFDCYDPKASSRLQIKACSVIPDLTSFGPKSVWDELYFLDFYRKGNWDGTFDVYLIPNDLVYGFPVNDYQTFSDQQKQGRRPRFSIWGGIIVPEKLSPIKTMAI